MTVMPTWMDGVAFTVAAGREHGISDGRMRGPAFERPHHGVRVVGGAGRIDDAVLDRCSDLRPVLPLGTAFSHATAARVWRLPLPRWVADDLHVISPPGSSVRRPGVIGWKRGSDLSGIRIVHGLAVTSPADTWVMLATMSAGRGGRLTREWLVAVGDHLVSGRRTRFGREAPLATVMELEDARVRHGSGRGAAALAWALPRIRSVVDSPPETFLRLGLVRHRLPEPVIQPPIPTAVGIRHPDLAYLENRLLLEYLGDVHRVDAATWRADLTRVQVFEDAGYRTMLVGADDVTPEGMPALAARVRRALR